MRPLPASEWKLVSADQAKQALGVEQWQLLALARIELVDQRWADGRKQTGVRLPSFLLERGLGVPSGITR